MHTVEQFAEHVAKHYLGEVHEGGDESAIDPATIAALIEVVMLVVMTVIDNCPARDAEVIGAVKTPTRRQTVLFRKQTVKVCDCCSTMRFKNDAGKIADCIMACAKNCTDEDCAAIIADATDPTYIVI